MRQTKSTQEIRDSLTSIHQKLKLLEEQNILMTQLATQALAIRARGTRDNFVPLAKEHETAKIVLKDIQEHPGAARKDIVERTKVPAQDVTKAVTLLQAQEQVLHLGSRRTTRWFSPDVLKELLNK
jgi:hypothetical protein